MADYYSDNADALFERYNALDFETVHADLLSCLPETPGAALDVGAGAGRDALALARRGWDVVAVEPAHGLRERGETYTRGHPVQWMDDRLPGDRLGSGAIRAIQSDPRLGGMDACAADGA